MYFTLLSASQSIWRCVVDELWIWNCLEKDTQQELAKFVQILGILNNTFKPSLVQKFSRIKVYNALPITINLYEMEIWRNWIWKFLEEQSGTSLLIAKGMKKFWKTWKQSQLTRSKEDTNQIGYDM